MEVEFAMWRKQIPIADHSIIYFVNTYSSWSYLTAQGLKQSANSNKHTRIKLDKLSTRYCIPLHEPERRSQCDCHVRTLVPLVGHLRAGVKLHLYHLLRNELRRTTYPDVGSMIRRYLANPHYFHLSE